MYYIVHVCNAKYMYTIKGGARGRGDDKLELGVGNLRYGRHILL